MQRKNRFIKGYSGLRALAVIGVILYHFDPNTFIGGYLGVPIFFVLSGYLVTDHILASYEETGYYDNKRFYLSRLKRLYPQLVTVLWASGAYMLMFQQQTLAKFNQIVTTNLFNVYNFWQIANGQSYFERFAGNVSPFTHLWTMSIEGQFYIFWPLIMMVLIKFCKTRYRAFWIIIGFSILSALEMAILYQPNVDTSRIYYGTDTRFFALGLGAALAFVWPIKHLKREINKTDWIILDITGTVSLIGMLWLFLSRIMDPQAAFAYRGGMFLFSLFTTIFVAIIAHPASHWNQIFTNRIFDWIGSRSYAIYLYQFPVMIFFEAKFTDMANHAFLYHLIELILILGLAELTYHFIEKPFSKISFESIRVFIAHFKDSEKNGHLRIASGVSVLILILGTIAVIKAPDVKGVNANKSQLAERIKKNRASQKKSNKQLIDKFKKTKKKENKSKAFIEAQQSAKNKPVNKDFEKYGISQIDLQLAQKIHVTAIGDSVMAGTSDMLKKLMPNALIDAAVSRQLVPTIGLFNQYKNQGALAENVLIGLGTNGPFSMDDINHLMEIIGPNRQVFWISVHVPSRQWQGQVNELILRASQKYKNLSVIDWYSYSANHNNWFYGDQTHPNVEGSKYYSTYITKEILKKAKF